MVIGEDTIIGGMVAKELKAIPTRNLPELSFKSFHTE